MKRTTTSVPTPAKISGLFEVGPGEKGEYAFMPWAANDSIQLKIDGQLVMNYDNVANDLNGGAAFDVIKSLFLDEGEHDFELLMANVVNAANPAEDINRMDASLYMRGPDSVTRLLDSSFVYQAVPEPTALICFSAGGWLLLTAGPRRCRGLRGGAGRRGRSRA